MSKKKTTKRSRALTREDILAQPDDPTPAEPVPDEVVDRFIEPTRRFDRLMRDAERLLTPPFRPAEYREPDFSAIELPEIEGETMAEAIFEIRDAVREVKAGSGPASAPEPEPAQRRPLEGAEPAVLALLKDNPRDRLPIKTVQASIPFQRDATYKAVHGLHELGLADYVRYKGVALKNP